MATSTITRNAVIEFIRSVISGGLTIELATGGVYVLVGASSDASLNFMGIINVTSGGAVLYTPTYTPPSTSISVTTSTNSITITNSSAVGCKISLIHLAN